jgi:parallel beta-helix repeat protein
VGTDDDGVSDAAERNVISGNGSAGVIVNGSGADHNVVAGSFIGTDVTGTVALGNGAQGVRISNGGSSNLIGTDGDGLADAEERNIISGNSGLGVYLFAANQNTVAGNYIGTDVTGTVALGNGERGVLVQADAHFGRHTETEQLAL